MPKLRMIGTDMIHRASIWRQDKGFTEKEYRIDRECAVHVVKVKKSTAERSKRRGRGGKRSTSK